MRTYILDDQNNPVLVPDALDWARWFAANRERKRVGLTQVTPDIRVSTVFLGIDHRCFGDGPPLIFESMTFGPIPELMDRSSTWGEAVAGHEAMVDEVKRWRVSSETVNGS